MQDLANFKEKYTWNMIEREKILSYYNKAFIADIHDTSMHECQHALESLFCLPFLFLCSHLWSLNSLLDQVQISN